MRNISTIRHARQAAPWVHRSIMSGYFATIILIFVKDLIHKYCVSNYSSRKRVVFFNPQKHLNRKNRRALPKFIFTILFKVCIHHNQSRARKSPFFYIDQKQTVCLQKTGFLNLNISLVTPYTSRSLCQLMAKW